MDKRLKKTTYPFVHTVCPPPVAGHKLCLPKLPVIKITCFILVLIFVFIKTKNMVAMATKIWMGGMGWGKALFPHFSNQSVEVHLHLTPPLHCPNQLLWTNIHGQIGKMLNRALPYSPVHIFMAMTHIIYYAVPSYSFCAMQSIKLHLVKLYLKSSIFLTKFCTWTYLFILFNVQHIFP